MATFLYIIFSFVIVLLAIRFALAISMQRKKGQLAPELSGKMGKAVRQGKKVLFYFYGPTCPPCVRMAPAVDNIIQKYSNVFKIDVSKEMVVSRKFGVMGTPALVLVEHGKIVNFIMGPQSEQQIESILN